MNVCAELLIECTKLDNSYSQIKVSIPIEENNKKTESFIFSKSATVHYP